MYLWSEISIPVLTTISFSTISYFHNWLKSWCYDIFNFWKKFPCIFIPPKCTFNIYSFYLWEVHVVLYLTDNISIFFRIDLLQMEGINICGLILPLLFWFLGVGFSDQAPVVFWEGQKCFFLYLDVNYLFLVLVFASVACWFLHDYFCSS